MGVLPCAVGCDGKQRALADKHDQTETNDACKAQHGSRRCQERMLAFEVINGQGNVAKRDG
jgi:hypothetical protein